MLPVGIDTGKGVPVLLLFEIAEPRIWSVPAALPVVVTIPLVPFFSLPRLHRVLAPHLGDVRTSYLATQRMLIRNGWSHRHASS